MVNRLIKFSLCFLLLRPSSFIDNINMNKSTFISATDKNRYLQLMFKNKMPLTRIGAKKEPNRNPVFNLIIVLLLFN